MTPEEICTGNGVTLEYHRESRLISMHVEGFTGTVVFLRADWCAIVQAWLRFDGTEHDEKQEQCRHKTAKLANKRG